MADPMNSLCQAARFQATEDLLLGRPLPAAVARHVAGCAECAAECEGVRRVVRTFESAEALSPASGPRPVTGPPPWDVARRPGHDGARRRPRRSALLVAAAVLAAVAVLVPLALSEQDPGHPVAAVTVSREGLMIPHPWGTEVPVTLSGLRPGETYRMLTADAAGHRMPGGSITAPGTGARTRLMTAMNRESITSLLVEDQHGRVVADLPVQPPPASSAPGPTSASAPADGAG